jgi:AbrB family looped-hinge helix DNA binding protein
MQTVETTIAERGQIVIPKQARDELGLLPGAKVEVRVEGGQIIIRKLVKLDLQRWIGSAEDDGLTSEQALSELRGRPVPHSAAPSKAKPKVKATPKRKARA